MRLRSLAVFSLACLAASIVLYTQEALAQCAGTLDPNRFNRTVVRMERMLGSYGLLATTSRGQGSAWFSDEWHLETNAHVVDTLHLTHVMWSRVELTLHDQYGRRTDFVRRVRVSEYARQHMSNKGLMNRAYARRDDVATLELNGPVPGSERLRPRLEPIEHGLRVMVTGYSEGVLTYAHGRVVDSCLGDSLCSAGGMMLHLWRGRDHYPLKPGVSGSPVMTCDGEVVGTVWSRSGFHEVEPLQQGITVVSTRAAPLVRYEPLARHYVNSLR